MADTNNVADRNKEDDWAQEGNNMVDNGSDGVWFRVGPSPDSGTFLGRFFGCRCNPIVTIMGSVMLFGMVIFCWAMTPGEYCLKKVATTSEVIQPCKVKRLDSGLTNCTCDEMTRANDQWSLDSPTVTEYVATVDVNKPDCKYTVKVEKLEKKECYVPKIELRHWMAWVTYTFTWLYIGTQDVWIVFMLYVIFSKYGALKLGNDSDVPEFTNIEWFSMIFCCGVATGLFFFSCGEPINHYEPCAYYGRKDAGPNFATGEWTKCLGTYGSNRYAHLPANERAQHAMTLTFYHWGLHGWICYAIAGCLLAVLHYRKGLPMTMKTCFYPIIGKRVYSFWGDVIDSVSIAVTTFGVCTSLAMGVAQINAGIRMLNGGKNWLSSVGFFGLENKDEWYGDYEDKAKNIWQIQTEAWKTSNEWNDATASKVASFMAETDEKMLLIWIITFVSTISIMTGLDIGVKWLSIIAMVGGMFLLWVIFVLDDTYFILNLFVQTVGHYFQYVTEIGFYTGAFDQPEHGGPDGRQETFNWMNGWTIFYWGWWISWAPFVGVFLARISKGRTVREFLITALLITVAYNFLWMTVWGGATLKMEMAATKYGVTCDDPGFRKNVCRPDPTAIAAGFGRYSGETTYLCSTLTKISCHNFNYPPMIYDVVAQYGSLGPFLSFIIIICLFLYFITSSDSGSLVDTIVASNGIEEPCAAQRVYWSLTEGLAATALLYASNYMIDAPNSSMRALQALSIAGGLPYTVLVCLMCISLWKAFRYESGEERFFAGFRSSSLDVGLTLYSGAEGKGKHFGCRCLPEVNTEMLKATVMYAFCPILGMYKCLPKLSKQKAELSKEKAEKTGKAPKGPASNLLLIVTAGLLFYVGWFLIIFDGPIRVDDGHITRGVPNGTYNLVEKKYSSRYGHFHRTTNEWKDGEALTYPKAPTDEEKAMGMEMTVGDRQGGTHQQLAVFGWFFYVSFCCLITVIRTSTRETLKIPGNLFEDFTVSLFFPGNVLRQCDEVLTYGKAKEDLPCNDGQKIETSPKIETTL